MSLNSTQGSLTGLEEYDHNMLQIWCWSDRNCNSGTSESVCPMIFPSLHKKNRRANNHTPNFKKWLVRFGRMQTRNITASVTFGEYNPLDKKGNDCDDWFHKMQRYCIMSTNELHGSPVSSILRYLVQYLYVQYSDSCCNEYAQCAGANTFTSIVFLKGPYLHFCLVSVLVMHFTPELFALFNTTTIHYCLYCLYLYATILDCMGSAAALYSL